MVESGGSKSAFLRDPLQVNNPGDFKDPKARVTGRVKGQQMTPQISVEAALKWLEFKGYFRDGTGKPGTWIGFEGSLQRYNGRKTLRASGVQQDVLYASEVLGLYKNARKSGEQRGR
jgi:hypothetical protein